MWKDDFTFEDYLMASRSGVESREGERRVWNDAFTFEDYLMASRAGVESGVGGG